MTQITAILKAAHCKSTHHHFAIDAIEFVQTDQGHRLGSQLLANFQNYLKGAKDPDTVFKDFENHVVHVRDGYWGGAAKTAEKWLSRVRTQLASQQWADAAYSIGVLSHYFTDPFMPLHTGQTPRESAYHRPLEWSVCCAYQEIFDLGEGNPDLTSFELSSSSTWLTDAILEAATQCNVYYDVIMDNYVLEESGRKPALALMPKCREVLSQIFVWAITGWAEVLDRIASEVSGPIPEAGLSLPALQATLQVPMQKVLQSIDNANQRKEVASIMDEYLRTGEVKKSLPQEQLTVRKVRQTSPELRPAQATIRRVQETIRSSPVTEKPKPTIPIPAEKKVVAAIDKLKLSDPIVDAPAIGPKTAARFEEIECFTIRDFLRSDSSELASKLATRWITVDLIENWKSQTELMMAVDGLTAVGTGLMVLGGITSPEQLRQLTADRVVDMVLDASKTAEGVRLLRGNDPPTLLKVQQWMQSINQNASNQPVSTLSQTG